MGRRGWGLVAVACALVATGGTAQAKQSAVLTVTGSGGQSAVLDVGGKGMTIGYPFFQEARVPGPNGAVGGVIVQRVTGGALVGGVLLQNAPGFDVAIEVPLVDFEKTRLRPGRYRFTLLGSGRQSVHLDVLAGSAPRRLRASGAAHPLTRVVSGSAPAADTWSQSLGRITANDYVITGAGSGGDGQQADDTAMCVQSTGSAAGDPCVGGEGFGISPGAGGAASWSGALYPPGDLKPGSYLFSGHAFGVGPSSTSGHSAVVLSPGR